LQKAEKTNSKIALEISRLTQSRKTTIYQSNTHQQQQLEMWALYKKYQSNNSTAKPSK
jgi:membrane protein insertase Oxa1/YidC/SpoIIIJ